MKKIVVMVIFVFFCSTTIAMEYTFKDPSGDDDGPGSYIYPTDRVYLPGSFDILELTVKEQSDLIVFKLTLASKIENPWEMDSGFSIQMAQIYLDFDRQMNSGHQYALPGMNAAFNPDCYWEKVIIISPQPASRIKTEVNAKASDVVDDVIIPVKVSVQGRSLIASVQKEDLGEDFNEETGLQLLVTSNEGFPDASEILSRKVNEYEGQHRFGGGSDYSGDPHFLDMLWPPAQGSSQEVDGQHRCLAQYISSSDPGENVVVKLPMVHFARRDNSTNPVDVQTASEPRVDTRVVGFKVPPPQPRDTIQSGNLGLKWNGKIYTSWLSGNDVTEHSVYVDPFGDGGHNGINSELELNLQARISDFAEAGARIKNRFRKNYWATYWANEDLDESQYMKLRGVWVRFKPPGWISPFIDSVHVGSSDLGMFNPWTVGRIRFTDRDNAMGTFISGKIGSAFNYDLARISLPEPWAGPGWSTRGKGYFTADGFFTRDFAYAGSLNFELSDKFRFRVVGDYTLDEEGDPDDSNLHDGVDRIVRYRNKVLSTEFSSSPFNTVDVSGLFAYAESDYRAKFDYIEKKTANPIPQKDLDDVAMKFTLELNDPFNFGLSAAVEYFNIGDDFITLMGARRESDVLLTEGFESDDAVGASDWGGWSGTMGQVPSLNVDNYDTQFTETCYQTIVGWKGETIILNFQRGGLELSTEYTQIGYNSNMQGRDMGIYWIGSGFGAPDNAYNEYQDRDTKIMVFKGQYDTQLIRPVSLKFRLKNIDDSDNQDLSTTDDDYNNDKWIYDFGIGCTIFDELYVETGYTLYDKSLELGKQNRDSEKNKYYITARYNFGGVRIGYTIEKFTGEDWDLDSETNTHMKYDDWDLVRSHAFLEVAF